MIIRKQSADKLIIKIVVSVVPDVHIMFYSSRTLVANISICCNVRGGLKPFQLVDFSQKNIDKSHYLCYNLWALVCQSHKTTKPKSSTWGITHFWYSMHWTAIRLIRKVIILFLATLIHLVWREHDPGSVSGGPPSLSALHHYIYEGSSLQALRVFFFAANMELKSWNNTFSSL